MRHVWLYFRQSARQQFSRDISSERSCLTWQSSLKCHMKCGPNCLILLHPCKRILVRIMRTFNPFIAQIKYPDTCISWLLSLPYKIDLRLDWSPSQLAVRRWPNVSPTSTLTLSQRRHTDVGPTWICQLAQRCSANVGRTLHQHRSNVGTLALDWRWRNITPMVVCQRCPNIGPATFLIMGCDLNGCLFGCVDQENISW